MSRCLAESTKPSQQSLDGTLRTAAHRGDFVQIQQLLANGANVNAADIHGTTALLRATWKGHSRIVIHLVMRGASLDAADGCGDTALHSASWKCHLKIVHYLIKHGKAHMDSTNEDGDTPLHCAILHSTIPRCDYMDTVRYLIKHGQANVNAANKSGETALHMASWDGYLDTVQYLIEHGKANLHATNKRGQTALHVQVGNLITMHTVGDLISMSSDT